MRRLLEQGGSEHEAAGLWHAGATVIDRPDDILSAFAPATAANLWQLEETYMPGRYEVTQVNVSPRVGTKKISSLKKFTPRAA